MGNEWDQDTQYKRHIEYIKKKIINNLLCDGPWINMWRTNELSCYIRLAGASFTHLSQSYVIKLGLDHFSPLHLYQILETQLFRSHKSLIYTVFELNRSIMKNLYSDLYNTFHFIGRKNQIMLENFYYLIPLNSIYSETNGICSLPIKLKNF